MLHRVIGTADGTYLIRGDNRIRTECVPEEWIIGVMTGYYGDGQSLYTSCSDESYRRYVKSLKIRYSVLWLQALPGRVKRRIIRRLLPGK